MKVGILTFHSANNYGAFLQAFALVNTLNSFNGVSAEIIDYSCLAIENDYDSKKLLQRNGNKVKNIIAYLLRKNKIEKTALIFENARDKYLVTSRDRLSKEEMAKIEEKFDLFIAGSDQVWNFALTKDDRTFFLDFVSTPQKKASYAASMGDVDFNDSRMIQLKKDLGSFTYLSLRESESARLLSSILKRDDIVTSIDPVFLITVNEWKKYITPPKECGYILYFCIGFPMDSTITFAKELARKTHKKLLLLMDKDIPYKYVTISHLKEVDPMLFISYIYYADCIVTNSFHATAFSILFHKEFYVETVVKRRERILNLLNLTGMNDRGLENGKATNTQVSTNWQSVDNKLQPWIDDSIDYLKFITTGL